LSELSETTGTPIDTLRGILNTLVAHNLLRHSSEGYGLGFEWLRLATICRNQFDARSVALPLMTAIRDALNETVILSVRNGDQRIQIDSVESKHLVRRQAQIGRSSPLHTGATGLALLSTLPCAELDDYLGRIKNWLAPVIYRRIERELAAVQKDGFAVAAGSVAADAAAIAAATRLYAGQSVAIAISCPIERFTQEFQQVSCQMVRDAISQLSSKLGVFM
jgi:DNA-binding IclR family transcriptional regulator